MASAKLAAQRILGMKLGKIGERLVQHRFSDDQLADKIKHGVDAFSVDAQQRFGRN